MFKEILFFCCLLFISSNLKNNPVSSTDGNTRINENEWITITNRNYARGFFCSAKVN